MIIPSIDIMNGQAVQLIGGKEKAIEAGDPRTWTEKFGMVGEIAVVDLDAALGRGNNTEMIQELVQIAPCRVGGGIRSVEAAIRWLDAGAEKVMLGTAATPEILSRLPKERVIAAVDAVDGQVVINGWQKQTESKAIDRVIELSEFVDGFLVTFVEREGRMAGTDLDQAQTLIQAAGGAQLTVAGGISTPREILELDRIGADAQVGMALYNGTFDVTDALSAILRSDRTDGLWPTVVTDQRGFALGLAWSSEASLRQALQTRRGVYHSRRRGLWIKGETSGATQTLLRVDLDCDRDCLRFTVRQESPGFCHRERFSCWGQQRGVQALQHTLQQRILQPSSGSYTARLLSEPGLLDAKLREEAGELIDATDRNHIAEEAADLLYFTLVKLCENQIDFSQIEAILDHRAKRITRRKGDSKSCTEVAS